ncbi:hypothetical protein OIO90_004494 [Microbotryomycetes sp. JL221]|nr:hypothetical protein OIO90_004494 [Microbotryomycetes sp. JL221]
MSAEPVTTALAVEVKDELADTAESDKYAEATAVDHEADAHGKQDLVLTQPPPAVTFPDGGIAAYRTVTAGTLTIFSTFGVSISFGVLQAELKQTLLTNNNASEISWIGSAMMTIAFASALPAGRLFDQGYYRQQLAAGSLLFTFSIFMLSLSTKYYQVFLSYAVGCGRTLMLGIVAAGPAAAGCIFPIAMNNLFPKLGFATTIRIVGATCGVLLLTANLLVVPRKLPRRNIPVFKLVIRCFRQPLTWVTCPAVGLVMLGCFVPMFYIQVFSIANGADEVVIKYGLAIMNGSAVVSRVLSGFVADRYGVLNTAIPVALSIGVLSIAMYGATSTGSAIAFNCLYGFASGGWITISAPIFMSLADSVSEIGVRSGVGFIFVAIGVLMGSPLAGQILLAADGNYLAPLLYAGLASILGTVLLVLARIKIAKVKGTWKV